MLHLDHARKKSMLIHWQCRKSWYCYANPQSVNIIPWHLEVWKFYRNEVNDAANENDADSYKKYNNKTTKSKNRLSIRQK